MTVSRVLPPLVEPGPALTRDETRRYARHLLIPAIGSLGQRRLRAARVAVLGAGGLGAPALLYLAAAGVGRLTIIDDDVVDVTNLQRQVIHPDASVGRPKIESAAEAVRALNPSVEVVTHGVRLTLSNAADLFGDADLVLDGTDNFETRYAVNDACAALGLPYVWASVYRTQAQVSLFWSAPPEPFEGVDLRDLFPVPPAPGTVPSCGDAGVLGALTGQVGSLMAAEAVKLICGVGEPLLGRVVFLDLLATTMTQIPLRPRRRDATAVLPTAVTSAAPDANTPLTTPYAVATLAAAPTNAASERDPGRSAPDDPGAVFALVSPIELAAELASDAPPVVLDVREPGEVEIAAIDGSVRIPLGSLLLDPGLALATGIAPDADLVVHCKVQPRAEAAVPALAGAGFSRIRVLAGGMLAWISDVDPDLPAY